MVNCSPNVYASSVVTLTFATLAVLFRFVARRITRASYGYDDALCSIAYLSAVAYNVIALIWAIAYGLGRPIADGPQNLTPTQRLQQSWFLLWLGSVTYSFALAFSKFAILAFYWRLFQHSNSRRAIQIISCVAATWFIVRILMVTMQCIPLRGLWDASIDKQCINESIFFFSTILTHVLIDISILILPIIEVRKLHLPPGQKAAVLALFMFGALVCIMSFFVLYESLKFKGDSQELALNMGVHIAWAIAETNLGVISTSLPMLRPIFRKITPGSLLSSWRGSRPIPSSSRVSGRNRELALRTIVIEGMDQGHSHDCSSSMHQLADGPEDLWNYSNQMTTSIPGFKPKLSGHTNT